ncbi:unnamed protein product [Urochloa decumbens]|uniref:DNA topoisomerase 2 n=1 Tax=Urochloa decumbens TaxID=240449 RepID=A0ABC9EHY1_9POAL
MEGCFELKETDAYGFSDVDSLSRWSQCPLVRSWVISKYGSVQYQQSRMLLFDGVDKLYYDTVTCIPAIARIVEEYLLKVANLDGVTNMEIGLTNGMFSVHYNGNCIPVEIDDNVYNKPLVVFESSIHEWENKFKARNPDFPVEAPTVEQVIFMLSSMLKFHVKDTNTKKLYEGTWSSEGWKENVEVFEGKQNMSKVEFQIPLRDDEDEGHFQKIMKTRAIQIQATMGNELNIQFNGQKLDVRSFSKYVNMYPKKVLESRAEALPRICKQLNEKLEVCITRSDGIFEQESFVNGTRTIAGGTHVDLLVEKVESHARKTGIFKKDEIKNSMVIFINFSIDDPQFSFSNDCLNSKLDDDILSSLTDDYLDNCVKNITMISHKRNNTTNYYLEDAEKAGGLESRKCTLILCEGVSAAKFVRSGLSYLGRDCHGILTLEGKLPNAFQPSDDILKHKDLQNIVRALGLDVGVHYNNTNFLRYGHLMLMSDQDVDGSHIKGLIINFLATYWPSLLKIDGFLSQFVTPVVKAQVDSQPHDFYSTVEFDILWQSKRRDGIRDVRYFKGLAAHMDKDSKDYFTNKVKHNKIFKWRGGIDYNAIELAFSPDRANERKIWLKKSMNFMSTQPQRLVLDMKDAECSYHDFIHKELVHYSISDVWRSIPSFVDGLKPSQRKVLYAAFAGGLESESEDQVYQFSGYVCKKTAYHHGGSSMEKTIIGMAQNFVGKNNISLLEPKGQFGSRIEGAEGSADARYLHIQLGRFANLIFRNEDVPLLSFLHEDGMVVEPRWFLPVLPMCIVNGCDGVATGWSTSVPMFDPKVIIQNLFILLKNKKEELREELIPMRPHYIGFKGEVECSEETGVFKISGLLNEINDTEIEITDIPPTQTISEYKKFLLSLTLKPEPEVENFQELHEQGSIKFKVKFLNAEKLKNIKKNVGLLNYFRLVSQISTSNMNMIGHNGVMAKFHSAEDIIHRFFYMRLPYYAQRKDFLLAEMKNNMDTLDNIIRFLQEIRNHDIIMDGTIVEKLNERGYKVIGSDKDFDHLLKIPLSDICAMDREKLLRSKDGLVDKLAKLEKVTDVDLWIKDLDELMKALDEAPLLSQKRSISPGVAATSASSPAPKRIKGR